MLKRGLSPFREGLDDRICLIGGDAQMFHQARVADRYRCPLDHSLGALAWQRFKFRDWRGAMPRCFAYSTIASASECSENLSTDAAMRTTSDSSV